MQIKTPAKINPYLRILGRREEGYHEIDLSLVPISLYDGLELRRTAGSGISLEVESLQPLGVVEDNLVYRAAMFFQQQMGAKLGVRIYLRKSIPAGAGLGGGSGNAAGTLLALNALHDHVLSHHALADAARQLGADVPFFLQPAPCRAQGRGDRLSPLVSFPQLSLLVVKPSFSISTHAAYQGVAGYSEPMEPPLMNTLAEVLIAMENQFEAPLFSAYPALGEAKAQLLKSGAAGALLSGSGSALFGVYNDAASRNKAIGVLDLDTSWQVIACETLTRHEYLPES